MEKKPTSPTTGHGHFETLKSRILEAIERELNANRNLLSEGTYTRDDGSGGLYTKSDITETLIR